MIYNAETEYIDALIAHTEETLRLLSNDEKSKWERMICAAFLRCLGVRFSPANVESPKNDPPDVTFKEANFEVRELLDEGRRRGDEYKEKYEILTKAKNIEDTFLPCKSNTPISYQKLFDIIAIALSGKANHYGRQGCSSLDALVYINLLNRFLDPATRIPTSESLISQGWRSVSFVLIPYSHVIFAKHNAPIFLRSNEGQTKKEWDDPDTFFELM
jgi:hypothetical protein